MKTKSVPLKERLMLQIAVDEKTGCWNWKGANGGKRSGNSGYGIIDVDGESTSSHRAAWIIFNGKIEPGLCVLHRCDNRKCCNPEHLYVGTKKQNRKDFMDRHPRAKELVRIGIEAGAKGVKRFWDSMTKEEKKGFCANRAAKQAEKRKQ